MLAIAMCLTPSPAQAQGMDWWHAVDHRQPAPIPIGLPPTAWLTTPARPDDAMRMADTATTDEGQLPLEEAIRQGLALNPAVRAAVADAESAGTDVDIAKWGYFPSVDLSAGPEEFPFEDIGYDVSATQMLYDWGKVNSQVARPAPLSARRSSSSALPRKRPRWILPRPTSTC